MSSPACLTMSQPCRRRFFVTPWVRLLERRNVSGEEIVIDVESGGMPFPEHVAAFFVEFAVANLCPSPT